MSLTETVIKGTLKADGTLELDEKPNVMAGRVQVIVQSLSKPTPVSRGLVEVMREIRVSQHARGFFGRSVQDAQTDERNRQQEDADYDQRCEELWGGPLASRTTKE